MFRKLVLTLLVVTGLGTISKAQTLFTYGGKPVSKEEFLRVYQKNALNKKPDFSDTALRSYLNLYSLFRMKVDEAEGIRLDTMVSLQRELDNYRRQLAKNYLTDKSVTDQLIHEAYDRMKEEVHVAHIMISAPLNYSPEDTLKAWNRIDSIYSALQKGADFSAMAKAVSDDRGSKDRGGDIGYMTALQTLYAFENAVYSTPNGKYSKPFRTQFGYHIIKVLDRRPARGEVKVSQILLETPKSAGDSGIAIARKRLDSLKRDIRAGKKWEDLVKQYSNDKYSVNDGGVLAPFGVGRMVPAFETAAFNLKKAGDISEPIQTEYGFHVIRLIEKYPPKPFDSVADALKKRIDNDSRSAIAHEKYLESIKTKNNFKDYPQNLEAVITRMSQLPDTGRTANTFKAVDFRDMNQPLFTMAGNTYTQSDLISFAEVMTHGRLMGPKNAVVRDLYRLYVERTVNDFQEQHLGDENEDFRNLMQEYRNGIMLFELMDRNVWTKASKDTAGLQAFYTSHQSKYKWEPGFTGDVIRVKDQASLDSLTAFLAAHPTAKDEEIMHQLNTDAKPDAVSIQRGHYEFSTYREVPQSNITKNKISLPVKNNDGSFTVVFASEVYSSPTQKTLDEARGYVVADYQDLLERQWNDQLRARYPVIVDEKVYKTMVK